MVHDQARGTHQLRDLREWLAFSIDRDALYINEVQGVFQGKAVYLRAFSRRKRPLDELLRREPLHGLRDVLSSALLRDHWYVEE